MKRIAPRESSFRRINWPPIRTYADLQKQIHGDLLAQHPEWIDADGDCPMCAAYERRLAELIASLRSPGTKIHC